MARVTTKTGDDGYTSLLGSLRVPKYHRRIEACGALDEATSSLGLARALSGVAQVKEWIVEIQRDLYTMMGELATPPENYEKIGFKIRPDRVARLEALADDLKTRVEIGKEFIIPGNTPAGAALDVARAVVRRAEREIARMYHEGDVTNAEVLRYLNRLSDFLFIVARFEESSAGGSTPAR